MKIKTAPGKPRYAKEEVKLIKEDIKLWKDEEKLTHRELMGKVMYEYDLSHVTARNLIRDTLDK